MGSTSPCARFCNPELTKSRLSSFTICQWRRLSRRRCHCLHSATVIVVNVATVIVIIAKTSERLSVSSFAMKVRSFLSSRACTDSNGCGCRSQPDLQECAEPLLLGWQRRFSSCPTLRDLLSASLAITCHHRGLATNVIRAGLAGTVTHVVMLFPAADNSYGTLFGTGGFVVRVVLAAVPLIMTPLARASNVKTCSTYKAPVRRRILLFWCIWFAAGPLDVVG